MDTPPPPAISASSLVETLREAWKIAAPALRYVPKGSGSYHWAVESGGDRWFLTVDDLGAKPWIADDVDATFEGLTRAYGAASLLEEHRLPMAVGGLRTEEGTVLVRLSARYGAALFPFVAGQPGVWGEPLDTSSQVELVRGLAQLHRTETTELGLTERHLSIPERAGLVAALSEVDRPWTGGPLSERAREALAGRAARVQGWLEELDGLAVELEAGHAALVPTHGEPHPGNVIRSRRGVRLVDWDTVGLAPAERDLWMFQDGSPELLGMYAELTGSPLSQAALRFFSLAWALSDIASFTAMFREPHEATGSTSRKLTCYLRLLDGGSPAPYGT